MPLIGPLGSLSVYSNAQRWYPLLKLRRWLTSQQFCNAAQVACHEDGSMIVPMYNWSTLLAPHFKKIVGIKMFHHFSMLSSTPGILYVTEHTDTGEVSLTLLRDNWQPNSASLHPGLEPRGLSNDRKCYL